MDRWQDDRDRAEAIRRWLEEVDGARRTREAALAHAAEDLDPWLQRRADELANGSRKGLDASIWMALSAKVGVPADEIAAAAGVDLEYVEAVRERIGGRPRRAY